MSYKNKKVYYFGNEFIEEDSIAVKVVERLKGDFLDIDFIHIKDTFKLLDLNFENSLLLDVADSIKKVELIDASKIKTRGISSTHDFDLGFFLGLSGKEAKIIAIPINYEMGKAIEEVRKIILSRPN